MYYKIILMVDLRIAIKLLDSYSVGIDVPRVPMTRDSVIGHLKAPSGPDS
jgi:hypothetical protein